jgi:hypothetical protein
VNTGENAVGIEIGSMAEKHLTTHMTGEAIENTDCLFAARARSSSAA